MLTEQEKRDISLLTQYSDSPLHQDVIRQNILVFDDINRCLESHHINEADFVLIKSLIGHLKSDDLNDHLRKLVVAREKTDIDAFETQLDIKNPQIYEEAIKLRNIWKNITSLNFINSQSNDRTSAKTKWQKIAYMFSESSLSLKSQYWKEGYNQGEKGKTAWEDVWQSSKTNLPFIEWCDRVGIEDLSVDYFDDAKRERLKTEIKDGLIKYALTNEEVSTNTDDNELSHYICALSLDKELFIIDHMSVDGNGAAIHHSSLLSGAPVLFAGELKIHQGQLSEITMRSGHYKPKESDLRKLLSFLHLRGVKLSNVSLFDGHQNKFSDNAKEFLLRRNPYTLFQNSQQQSWKVSQESQTDAQENNNQKASNDSISLT